MSTELLSRGRTVQDRGMRPWTATVYAARVWNKLSCHVTSAPFHRRVFCSRLKTHFSVFFSPTFRGCEATCVIIGQFNNCLLYVFHVVVMDMSNCSLCINSTITTFSVSRSNDPIIDGQTLIKNGRCPYGELFRPLRQSYRSEGHFGARGLCTRVVFVKFPHGGSEFWVLTSGAGPNELRRWHVMLYTVTVLSLYPGGSTRVGIKSTLSPINLFMNIIRGWDILGKGVAPPAPNSRQIQPYLSQCPSATSRKHGPDKITPSIIDFRIKHTNSSYSVKVCRIATTTSHSHYIEARSEKLRRLIYGLDASSPGSGWELLVTFLFPDISPAWSL